MTTDTQSGMQLSQPLALEEHIREQERARIARDLHDELGAYLSGIKMALCQLREQLAQHETSSAAHQQARYAEQLADDAADAMHVIIDDLCPPILDFGLVEALEWQSRLFSRQNGIACTAHCAAELPALNEFEAITLFRIAREALTNIARHARADKVRLELRHADAALHLHIIDDGCGFAAATMVRGGNGLGNMRRRAQVLGGTLQLHSAPGAGTRIEVTVPLPPVAR